jgi:hypothetical protein
MNGNKFTSANFSLSSPPELQFSSASYFDDESQTAVVKVTRSGNPFASASIDVVLAGGTATAGSSCVSGVDYVFTSPITLNFGIYDLEQTISIPLCGDLVDEGTETVNLSLTNNVNADIGTPSTAVLNINDTASQWVQFDDLGMPLGGTALTYPSTITVAGGPTSIGSIRLTLYDVSHFDPDSIEVLLVGPGGQKYVLMADVGGSSGIPSSSPVTLTFKDSATAIVPDSATPITGVYLPTTCGTSGPFPAPAPAAPYTEPGCSVARPVTQSMFGTFGLTNSNGTWSLYVWGDNGSPFSPEGLAGEMAGWGLEFLPPTAAGVEVSGRVMTPDGRGLRNATVTMTDGQGVTRSAVTSSFGYYRFEGVPVGDSFVMTVNSRNYRFTPRVVLVLDTLTDVDFVGLE